jgi:hypothetical protein
MLVVKDHFFLVPVFPSVILDSPTAGKDEVDRRNGDPVAVDFPEMKTSSNLEFLLAGSRLKLGESTETAEICWKV